jgi:hypothetical protein
MERYIRLTERLDVAGKVFYPGSVVDTLKHPEVSAELERRALEAAKATRRRMRDSPLNKMKDGAEVTK